MQTRSRTRDVWDQAVTSLLLGEPKQVIQALLAAFSVRASAVSWKSNPSPTSFKKDTDTQPTLFTGFYLFSSSRPFFFYLLPLYFSALFSPSAENHLSSLSRTNKQCSRPRQKGPACPACLHLPAGWERWQREVLEWELCLGTHLI